MFFVQKRLLPFLEAFGNILFNLPLTGVELPQFLCSIEIHSIAIFQDCLTLALYRMKGQKCFLSLTPVHFCSKRETATVRCNHDNYVTERCYSSSLLTKVWYESNNCCYCCEYTYHLLQPRSALRLVVQHTMTETTITPSCGCNMHQMQSVPKNNQVLMRPFYQITLPTPPIL